MTGWREIKLGDVIEIFDHIRVPLSAPERAKRQGKFPYYGAQGIIDHIDHYLFDGRYLLIPEDGENLNSRKLPIAYFAEGQFWVNNHAHIVRGVAGLSDDVFLKHAITATDIRGYITGAAQPKLTQANMKRIAIRIPSISTQRRIASILGAYDDLIEVNRRRVAVLEAMARGLFEEWFVRFRFPGHENHKIIDTPNGPLPEGWNTQTIGQSFEMLGGGTPSKTEPTYWEGGSINWYTPSDLTRTDTLFMDNSGTKITAVGLKQSSARMFPIDSVMMTSRATIGAISINTTEAATNQGFIVCMPNARVPRTFLYYWLKINVPVFIGHATGATFKEITKGVFKQLSITVPAEELVARFECSAKPMHDAILAIERSNRLLVATRDLLLPRLISGELSVAAAERKLEVAA